MSPSVVHGLSGDAKLTLRTLTLCSLHPADAVWLHCLFRTRGHRGYSFENAKTKDADYGRFLNVAAPKGCTGTAGWGAENLPSGCLSIRALKVVPVQPKLYQYNSNSDCRTLSSGLNSCSFAETAAALGCFGQEIALVKKTPECILVHSSHLSGGRDVPASSAHLAGKVLGFKTL